LSETVVGDIGVHVGLGEEDLLAGAQRVNQALGQMGQQVERFGAIMDQTMSNSWSATERLGKGLVDTIANADKAIDSFKERLREIATERERAFAGMGDQMAALQKQTTTGVVNGNPAGAAQSQQQLIAMQREIVQAQRDALAEMAKDEKLSDEQYMAVKHAQNQAEQELRNLDVQAHKAAEVEKVAIARQAAEEQVAQAKQAAEAQKEAVKQAAAQVKEYLADVNAARDLTFGAAGDHLANLQKELDTAQVGGNAEGAARKKQEIIAMQREIVQAQRDALAEMAKDQNLTKDQFLQVKQAELKAEQELRNLDVAQHKAAEEEKVAASRKAAEEKKQAATTAAKAEAEVARKAAQEETDARKAAAQATAEQQQMLSGLQSTMGKIAATAAALAATWGMLAEKSLDAYKQQQAAFEGLESVASKTIGSTTAATAAAQSLAKDGLLTVAEASKALQNGLSAGYTLDQTTKMILAFKDAAAFGRKEGLGFGEAVGKAMEGVKMGRSVLLDGSGLTKNLSTMLTEAGKSAHDLQNASSDASVRQAIFNGILKEGALFAGNAAKATETLAGAQAGQAASTRSAAVAIGEALAPAAKALSEIITRVADKVTEWVKSNPELARTIMLVVGAMSAAVAVVGTLTVAFLALNSAIGGAGLLIAGAIAGIAAIAGYYVGEAAAMAAARREQEQLDSSTGQLMRQYEALRKILDDNTTSTDDKERASSKLKDTLSKLYDLQPQMKSWFDTEGRLLDTSISKWDDKIARIEKASKAILEQDIAEAQKEANSLREKKATAEADAKEKFKESVISSSVSAGAGPFGGGYMRPGGLSEESMKVFEDLAAPALKDEVSQVTDELDLKIAIAEGKIAEAQIKLENLGKPMDPKTALGPPLITGNGDGDPDAADKERAKQLADALKNLQLQEQYAAANDKPLPPEEISKRLKAIKAQFADYLTAHPDEALSMEVQIAQTDQKGRQEAEKALKEALTRRMEIIKENESLFGSTYDQTGKGADLQGALVAARLLARSGDKATAQDGAKQVLEISKAIRDLDQSLQKANFETRFKGIAAAREDALAGMAGALHGIEKDLIDAENAANQLSAQGDEAGAQASRNRAETLKQAKIQMQEDVLKSQQASLEALLKDEKLTADERAQIERELTSVKDQLYNLDLESYKLTAEAKVAAEKKASDDKKKLVDQEREWLAALADGDLKADRARHTEDEKAAQAKIKRIQDELSALERKWAAEDAQKRKDDLKTQIANIKAAGGFKKVIAGPDGKPIEVDTYDEAKVGELEKQLKDQQTQDARDQERQRLQDRIKGAQDSLAALQESNRAEEDARQTFWTNIQKLDVAAYADLTKAANEGMGPWVTALSTHFQEAVTNAQTKATEIANAVNAINTAMAGLADFKAPTLPPSLDKSTGAGNSSTNVNGLIVNLNLPNVTNPDQFAKEAPAAVRGVLGGVIAAGKQRGRTRPI
jgi:hypothetical protein